jgi:hypothetical protein
VKRLLVRPLLILAVAAPLVVVAPAAAAHAAACAATYVNYSGPNAIGSNWIQLGSGPQGFWRQVPVQTVPRNSGCSSISLRYDALIQTNDNDRVVTGQGSRTCAWAQLKLYPSSGGVLYLARRDICNGQRVTLGTNILDRTRYDIHFHIHDNLFGRWYYAPKLTIFD